jgi:putative FmdB family regulatory protein
MPTYQYRCPLGHEFERFEKMSDRARTKCPECGRTAVRLISGGAGLIFKGSGFYITDYGKDGKGPRTEKETGASSESAPAAKEEATSPPPKTEGGGEASGKAEKKEKPARKKGSA